MSRFDYEILIFGAIFSAIGIMIFFSGINFLISGDEAAVDMIYSSIVFGGLGGVPSAIILRKRKRIKDILNHGKQFSGKIHSYVEDKSCYVNGDYRININVHYFNEMGIEREIIVPTGFMRGSNEFPIGATIDIKVWGNKCTWVKGSVRWDELYREDELMDDKPIDWHKDNVAVSCGGCGASFSAAKGYMTVCPYCGTKINC